MKFAHFIDGPGVAKYFVMQGHFPMNCGIRRFTYETTVGSDIWGADGVQGGVVKGDLGRIDVWPIRYHTITTSPQNTAALVPALKAALASDELDEIPADAVKAFLTGLDPDTSELLASSSDLAVQASDPASEAAVKAGKVLASSKEQRLRAALDEAFGLVLSQLDEILRAKEEASPQPENQ